MDNTYTFTSLLKDTIPLGNGEAQTMSNIMVPRIQRPYAQGREDEESKTVRNNFLSEIFALLAGKSLKIDLTFVYGKVENRNGIWTMELLDGQQRLTTLFLLHWYLLQRGEIPPENEAEVSRAIGAFTYETRDSSRSFCKLLAKPGRRLPMGGTPDVSPRKAIRNLLDYVMSHDEDPTVSAMLVMLDSIHEKYRAAFPNGGNGLLFERLGKISFRVLSLTEYKLSEDLYIKMNARGLRLTPFECFKADFLGLMDLDESTKRKVDLPNGRDAGEFPDAVSFKQRFSIRLDTVWCDLFWNPKKPELYDRFYMLFFARFFASRFLLEHQADIRGKRWQNDPDLDLRVFHQKCENDPEHYHGINAFRKMVVQFGAEIRYFDCLSRFLDLLRDRKKEILEAMKPLWESASYVQPDWFCDGSSSFEQMALVKASAVFEFARLFPRFPIDMFRVWMKCVNCVVENTNIDNYVPTANTAGNLASLLRGVAARQPRTLDDFVRCMAETPDDAIGTAAIREEVIKARRIAGSRDGVEAGRWIEIFDDISRHPFLKGMIGFYYSPGMSVDEFAAHSKLIRSLFGENGIAPLYREERHWMLRAIFAQVTTSGQFLGRYIVENNNKKYLKNLISSPGDSENQKTLQQRMNALFAIRLKGLAPGDGKQPSVPVLDAFRSAVREAPGVPDSEPWDVCEAVRILRVDEAFYSWALSPQRGGDVTLYWHCNQYQARVSKKWSCIMVPVFRVAQHFAQSAGMTPVPVSNGRDGFDAQYGMFIGQDCSMRRRLDIVPETDVEVRFLADYQRSYPVELWITWEKNSTSTVRERWLSDHFPGYDMRPCGGRQGIQINEWTFTLKEAGNNSITPEGLKKQVESVFRLSAPSAEGASSSAGASPESTP